MFQFHKVRLKERWLVDAIRERTFQFHKVRLKALGVDTSNANFYVSIP